MEQPLRYFLNAVAYATISRLHLIDEIVRYQSAHIRTHNGRTNTAAVANEALHRRRIRFRTVQLRFYTVFALE